MSQETNNDRLLIDPIALYEQELEEAHTLRETRRKAWSSESRKRKANRDPIQYDRIQGEWLDAKQNFDEVVKRRPADLISKRIKQQDIDEVMLTFNSVQDPIPVDDDDDDMIGTTTTTSAGLSMTQAMTAVAQPAIRPSTLPVPAPSAPINTLTGFAMPMYAIDPRLLALSPAPTNATTPSMEAPDMSLTSETTSVDVPTVPPNAPPGPSGPLYISPPLEALYTSATISPSSLGAAFASGNITKASSADMDSSEGPTMPSKSAHASPSTLSASSASVGASGDVTAATLHTIASSSATASAGAAVEGVKKGSKLVEQFGSKMLLLGLGKIKAELDAVRAKRDSVAIEISTGEHALCQPLLRTMEDIRSQLAAIDLAYTLANDLDSHIAHLVQVVQEKEQKQAEADKRKPLVAQRAQLLKDKEEKLNSLKTISPDLLKARQDEIEAIDGQLAEIDTALAPSKAVPAPKARKQRGKKKFTAVVLPAAGSDEEGPASDEEDDRKVMELWNSMTSEKKKEFTDAVRESIEKFAQTGKLDDFKVSHRKALRQIQSLLPEECFISKDVAIAIHITGCANLVCRYHGGHQKDKTFDGDGEFLVQGCGYRARYGKKHTPVQPQEGYMNCGCHIDDALLDFFFWKTLTIVSTRSECSMLVELMKGDAFRPRLRAFVIKLFRTFTFLDVDDIFTSNRPFGHQLRELYLYNVSRNRMAEYISKFTSGPAVITNTPAPEQGGNEGSVSME